MPPDSGHPDADQRQAEIDEARAESNPTRRATVAALEDILYSEIPVHLVA